MTVGQKGWSHAQPRGVGPKQTHTRRLPLTNARSTPPPLPSLRLIAIAFFLARGFIKTGLGNRIAYYVVSLFGQSTLGLTYSLVFSEALLAPAIPSLAARAGGIFLPLAKALCVACGSKPEDGTEKKMGAYVMTTLFQTSCITSGMFITAMAANPLSVNLAAAAIGHTISWGEWALAASVPGLICLVLVPLLLYIFYPPEIKDSPAAPAKAKEELAKLGAMSSDEKIMAGSLILTVGLWIFGASFGIGAVTAALIGLTILLVTGVVTWKECLAEGPAWDTLTWFAALIAMAACLNTFGLIPWFSKQVVAVVGGMGLAWQPAFLVIILLYFYSHYLFASGAAHIGAMYTAFLSVAVACGAPPVVSALVLGIFSNLMGCTTHYGIGSAPPFFGAGCVPSLFSGGTCPLRRACCFSVWPASLSVGAFTHLLCFSSSLNRYVPLPTWWTIGGLLSIVYITVFLGVGGVWWKVIGLY